MVAPVHREIEPLLTPAWDWTLDPMPLSTQAWNLATGPLSLVLWKHGYTRVASAKKAHIATLDYSAKEAVPENCHIWYSFIFGTMNTEGMIGKYLGHAALHFTNRPLKGYRVLSIATFKPSFIFGINKTRGLSETRKTSIYCDSVYKIHIATLDCSDNEVSPKLCHIGIHLSLESIEQKSRKKWQKHIYNSIYEMQIATWNCSDKKAAPENCHVCLLLSLESIKEKSCFQRRMYLYIVTPYMKCTLLDCLDKERIDTLVFFCL